MNDQALEAYMNRFQASLTQTLEGFSSRQAQLETTITTLTEQVFVLSQRAIPQEANFSSAAAAAETQTSRPGTPVPVPTRSAGNSGVPVFDSRERAPRPKLADVPLFDGKAEKYQDFIIGCITRFETLGYHDDAVKIQYVYTRLSGLPRQWVTTLYHNRANAPAAPTPLASWETFLSEFQQNFSDPDARQKALEKIKTMNMKSGKYLDYVTEFELNQAIVGDHVDRTEDFFRGLTDDCKMAVESHRLVKGDSWIRSRDNIHKFLLGYTSLHKRFAKSSSASLPLLPTQEPNVIRTDPMDLSVVNTCSDVDSELELVEVMVAQLLKPEDRKKWWNHMPKPLYSKLMQCLKECNCCLYCREYQGHLEKCPFKDKLVPTNKPVSSYLVSSFDPSSASALYLDIEIKGNDKIRALVDTGASGFAFIRRCEVDRMKLPLIEIKPVALKAFDGNGLEIVKIATKPVLVKVSGISYEISFIVTSQLNCPAIIGYPFLHKHRLLVDCFNHRLVSADKLHLLNRLVKIQNADNLDDVPASVLDDAKPRQDASDVKHMGDSSHPPQRSVQTKTLHTAGFDDEFASVLDDAKPRQDASDVKHTGDQSHPPPRSVETPTLHAADLDARKPVKLVPRSQLGPQRICSSGFLKFARTTNPLPLADCANEPLILASMILEDRHRSQMKLESPQAANDSLPDWVKPYASLFDLKRCEELPNYDPQSAMDIELLPDAQLDSCTPYKLSYTEEQCLLEEIEKGLKSGQIVISNALGACPVLFVKKPDGSLRMCIDYRRLNAISKSVQALLPNIDDILASLAPKEGKHPLYTKIDLKGAFHLLRVKDGKEDLTTFVTKFGKFKYRVVPFGLKNAPGHFQSVMNRLLHGLIGRGVWVFLDDIIIYESDPRIHRQLVCQVLQALSDAGMIANPAKCVFEVDTVDFLGFHLCPKGLSMQGNKLSAILDFPEPKNVKQLQSFLGLANFYRMFIPNYSILCLPFFNLLKKDASFVWGADCQRAFADFKNAFQTNSVLLHPDRTRPFILHTDASDFGIGAVLSQRDEHGTMRPVEFFSRKLKDAEINYGIPDKELLAIKEALVHWRYLLVDTEIPIEVHCDHENLKYFRQKQQLNRRQARWQETLADYHFVITYIKGSDNVVADALSRRSDFETRPGDPERTRNHTVLLPDDKFISAIHSSLNDVEPSDLSFEQLLRMTDMHEAVPVPQEEMDALQDVAVTDASNWLVHMLVFLKTGHLPPDLNARYTSLVRRHQHNFRVKDNRLYCRVTVSNHVVWVPYLPKRYRLREMLKLHELMGHLAPKSVVDSLKLRYYWPTMRKDFDKIHKECATCQMYNHSRHRIVHPLYPLPDPGVPFHTWHLDFIQDLPETPDGNVNILVAVDRSTRFTVAKPFPNRDTATMLSFVYDLISIFGCPSVFITDRGFLPNEFQDYCAVQGIDLRASTSYHPNTNGLVERVNGILESIMAKLCAGSVEKWDVYLPVAVYNLNARTHAALGYPPFYLAFGMMPKAPGDLTPPRAYDFSNDQDVSAFTNRELTLLGQDRAVAFRRSLDNAERMRQRHEDNHPGAAAALFQVGDFVKLIKKRLPSMMIPKFDPNFSGPYIIDSVGTHDSYTLRHPDGRVLPHPVNQNHLMSFYPGTSLRRGVVSRSDPVMDSDMDSDEESE